MTQQVRKTYRSHRKATWAGVLALVVAIAAIAIPIASGASDKTYKLAFAAATQANPSPPLNTTLCSGAGGTITLYLTNTAKSVSLGSARITVPSYVTEVKAFKSTTGQPSAEVSIPAGANFTWSQNNPVFLQNLGLNKWGYAKLELKISTAGASFTFGSVVKQSNNFNDSSGSANLFEDPSMPTLTVQTCFVTISGTVYRDDEGDGDVTNDLNLQSPPNHTVTVTGTGGSRPAPVDQSNGTYSVLVPKNGTYTVCIGAASGEVQTFPVNATCSAKGGYVHTGLALDSPGNHFGLVGGIMAACDSDVPLDSQFESADPPATVIARFSGTCKNNDKPFVFTTYDDGTSRVAKLSPVGSQSETDDCNLDDGTDCQIVAQQITWELTGSSPELKTLRYDDTDQRGSSGVMPFCKTDPFDRTASDGVTLLALDPGEILPDTHTTCLARTTQGRFEVKGVWVTRRIDDVYSAYDGKISFG